MKRILNLHSFKEVIKDGDIFENTKILIYNSLMKKQEQRAPDVAEAESVKQNTTDIFHTNKTFTFEPTFTSLRRETCDHLHLNPSQSSAHNAIQTSCSSVYSNPT